MFTAVPLCALLLINGLLATNPSDDSSLDEPRPDVILDVPQLNSDRLATMCPKLIKEHFDYLEDRMSRREEQNLIHRLLLVAERLNDHMKRTEKTHDLYSCDDAKDALNHEHAEAFIKEYEEFVDGHNPHSGQTYPPKDTVRLLTELGELIGDLAEQTEQRAFSALNDARDRMALLVGQYEKINEQYDAIVDQKGADDCHNNFKEFLSLIRELHDSGTPWWEIVVSFKNKVIEQACGDFTKDL